MTDKLFDLSGKIALVTGASQGLGFSIARGLRQA
jgi:gluconate 5-dehydrogenase